MIMITINPRQLDVILQYHISYLPYIYCKVLSLRRFAYTSYQVIDHYIYCKSYLLHTHLVFIIVVRVLGLPCTDRKKRKNYAKRLQTDPNGNTNGYGEKRGNPPFLYCNCSVEKKDACEN